MDHGVRDDWNLMIGQREPFDQVAKHLEPYRRTAGGAIFGYHAGTTVDNGMKNLIFSIQQYRIDSQQVMDSLEMLPKR